MANDVVALYAVKLSAQNEMIASMSISIVLQMFHSWSMCIRHSNTVNRYN